jgi:hypothetical protein
MIKSKKKRTLNNIILDQFEFNKDNNEYYRKLDVYNVKIKSYLSELKESYIYLTFYKLEHDLLYKIRNVMFFINNCLKLKRNTDLVRKVVYELAKYTNEDSEIVKLLNYYVDNAINLIINYEKALNIQFKLDNMLILINNESK